MLIAPWLERPNFLQAIEGGTQAGLALRRQAADESQFAQRMAQAGQDEQARQDEAAQRLRLSYASLAQQHDLSQQEIAARASQAMAAQALRQQSAESLDMWRKEQAANAQQRIVDQEKKIAAAAALKDSADKDINGFWKDLPDKGLAKSLQDHPFAAAEPGIRQAAAQKLINPKATAAAKPISVKYNLPDAAGTATGPLDALQKQFGTNLPPQLQAPETPKSPFQEGQTVRNKKTGQLFTIQNGEPVPVDGGQ